MVLFHLIFTLIKIGIQASIYATIVFLFTRIVVKIVRRHLPIDGPQFWWLSQVIISLSLFFYSFSYWGDHGLGDHSRIPIGHNQDVRRTDSFTYFITPDNEQREIDKFELTNGLLCAALQNGRFVIFELKRLKLQEYPNQEAYETFAQSSNLPMADNFRDFNAHYKEYWSGWRFWLLG